VCTVIIRSAGSSGRLRHARRRRLSSNFLKTRGEKIDPIFQIVKICSRALSVPRVVELVFEMLEANAFPRTVYAHHV